MFLSRPNITACVSVSVCPLTFRMSGVILMKLVTGTRETNDIEKAIGSKLKVNQR